MGRSLISFGSEAIAVRKRVKYINASGGTLTVIQGEPMCYNYDTTTNILGYDPYSAAESSTTTEGYQNEGKYMIVENPKAGNLSFFAGVVAEGAWVGKSVTNGSALWLEIYIANGATVPVYSYVSSTTGTTALYIMNDQQYFGNPAAAMGNGEARCVAVAEETVNRSSTKGLCLAKLCPDQFIYQVGSSAGALAKLTCCTAGTVNDITPNLICIKSSQTSGGFSALFIRSEVATAGSTDTALAIYSEANVTGVCSSGWCVGNRFSLNLWGGTQTASLITGLMAEIYEQDANLTGGSIIAPFSIQDIVDSTNPPASGKHWLMYFVVNGADKPDGLFYAESANAVGYATTSNVTPMAHIPIYINGVGTRYILLEDTA